MIEKWWRYLVRVNECIRLFPSGNLLRSCVYVCLCQHESCHLQFPLLGAWWVSVAFQAGRDNHGQLDQNPRKWIVHWCWFSSTRKSCHLVGQALKLQISFGAVEICSSWV